MSNWYKIAKDLSKIAQIWNYDVSDEDLDEHTGERLFSSKIKELYELEYKYSTLKNNEFIGHPKRKENILSQFEKNIQRVGYEIKNQLLITIGKWLDKHALLDPEIWANGRVEDSMNEDGKWSLHEAVREYNRYYDETGKNRKNIFYLINMAIHDINSYPYLKSFLEDYVMESYVEMLKNDAFEDLDGFNERYNTNFENSDDAAEFAEEKNDISNIDEDLLYMYIGEDDEFIISAMESNGQPYQISQEIYKNLVFPLWYDYWSSQGIDETREAVEKIYDLLRKANGDDIGNLIATINLGLNAVHQTGKMLDYLSEDVNDDNLSRVLKEMTEGEFVQEADSQLREIGVKI
jgi:hypothetical protein